MATNINIEKAIGVKLKTAATYCTDDIIVRPKLQSKTVTTNGSVTPDSGYCGLSDVQVNVQPKLQTKEVTPTKGKQVVQPDSSYNGLSQVTINAIPDDYIIPSGSQTITTNGTYDVTNNVSVIVNVDAAKPEQTKSITITENGTTTVTPDDGKVLTSVTITTNVPSGGEQPTLNAPSISLSGTTLTITNPASNGNFVTSYTLYNGSTEITTTPDKTINLSTYITTAGTYTLTVKAKGTNFNDSASSNSVTYTLQSQTTPAISLVSGTTIQIDTIDDNATTIEVFADGTSIGSVSKQ